MLNKEDKFIVITVADVMAANPLCVGPDTLVIDVIDIFAKNNFAGLPVIGKDGVLAGIVTQYDLITKGSGLHIPTLVKTLEDVKMLQPERMILEETLAPIKKLLVKDVMNNDPLFVGGDEPIEKAVQSFAEHHKVNPLIVIDKDKKVIGVLSRHDLIKILAMKELGKTVDMAYSRQRDSSGSEEVVGEAMKGIKKNFFFMPKYGVGKWVAMGLAIFIIGLVASFLFIVKIPDLSRDIENVVTANPGEAYLFMRSTSSSANVGDLIPVDVYVRFSGEANPVGTIFSVVSFSGGQEFMRVLDSGRVEDFVSGAQIFNLKTKEITLIWTPPVVGFVPIVGKEYYLGTLEFRALQKGQAIVNFKAGSPGLNDGTSVEDFPGRNILKAAEDFKFIIN